MYRITRKTTITDKNAIGIIGHDTIVSTISKQNKEYDHDAHWDKIRTIADWEDAEEDGRLVVLPTKIGGRVFITGEYEGNDGTIVRCVEGTNLAGFINEDGRPFYLCYSAEYGSCDIEPGKLFPTREEAEAALRKEDRNG